MNVKKRLIRAIRKCGQTPYAISMATGVDQSVLSRFLADDSRHRDIRLESAAVLCEYLGLELIAKRGRRK